MSDREAAIREEDEIAVMVAHYEPDALAAIVLEVRAELAAAREDRDEFAALIHRLQDRDMEPEDQWDALLAELAAAREREAALYRELHNPAAHDALDKLLGREAKLREALRQIAHPRWHSPGYARVIAQNALADGEGET